MRYARYSRKVAGNLRMHTGITMCIFRRAAHAGRGWMAKRCGKCRKLKARRHFNKDKRSKCGLQWICRDCNNNYQRKFVGSIYYRVIHDPWESFTSNSEYKRSDIEEMLHDGFLAVGTRFRRGKVEYRVNEDMRIVRL
jgi:hypothetical protein